MAHAVPIRPHDIVGNIYLIVDQERRRVDRYWRESGGDWQRERLVDQGRMPVACGPLNATLGD